VFGVIFVMDFVFTVTVPDQDNASPQQQQKSSAMYNWRDPQVTTPRTTVTVCRLMHFSLKRRYHYDARAL